MRHTRSRRAKVPLASGSQADAALQVGLALGDSAWRSFNITDNVALIGIPIGLGSAATAWSKPLSSSRSASARLYEQGNQQKNGSI